LASSHMNNLIVYRLSHSCTGPQARRWARR
jgi:hypothetical protein